MGIREAFPDEARLLSDLALRSKAHWGYSQDFLDSCRPELTVDPAQIGSDDYQYFATVDEDVIIGFYALEHLDDGYELEALFVEPAHIGTRESASIPGRYLPLFEIEIGEFS
jgi:hypothetical protein